MTIIRCSAYGISVAVVLASLALVGSQTIPPDIKQLQETNSTLQQQLNQANGDISKLQADKVLLEQDVAELNRVISVLGQEKSSRVEASTNLRGQVRQFVQLQIDNLKEFLLAADLLDYVGGELVDRSGVDDKPLLVVDFKNAIPLDGTLTSVGGYFQGVGSLSVKVLRPVGDNLVVVWASQPLAIQERGQVRLKFPVAVGVEKGDLLAYYFSQPGMIGFDTGTGDSRFSGEDVTVGSTLRRSSLSGEKQNRAYSVGVFGLLNAR